VEIMGKTKFEALRIQNLKQMRKKICCATVFFIFCGAKPDTGFLKGCHWIKTKGGGYCMTDDRMQSSLPGVFAAGDCRARPLNQVVTDVLYGAIAAISVMKFLENKT